MNSDPYDPIATYYDFVSKALGKSFRESKTVLLDTLNEGDKVLYIGGGTGRNLPLILEKIGTRGKIFYIEAASRMIERAKKSIPPHLESQVIFMHQSNFSAIPLKTFDVVVTQYFLDILTDSDIHELFKEVGKRIHHESRWIFVDFFEVRGKKWLICLMIQFFRLFTNNPRKDLPDYGHYFGRYGWQMEEKRSLDGGFIQAWLLKRVG